MKRFFCLLIAATLCLSAVAQEKKGSKEHKPPQKSAPAAPQGMPMPKPAPEFEKFANNVVGTWRAEAKFEANEMMPAGSAKGTATFKRGPGGMSIIQDYRSTGYMGKFAGMGLTWWDPKENAFKNTWCDTMTPSGCMVSNGSTKWEGNELKGTETMEMGGKKYKVDSAITDITPNSFTFYEDVGPEGGPTKRMMTIKYTRAGAATTAAKTDEKARKTEDKAKP
jgi:hypothetical protein